MRALHLVEIATPQQRYKGWYSERIADVERMVFDLAPTIHQPGQRRPSFERQAGQLHSIAGRISAYGLLMLSDVMGQPVHSRLQSVQSAAAILSDRIRAATGSVDAAREHQGTPKEADNQLRTAYAELHQAVAALKRLQKEAGL